MADKDTHLTTLAKYGTSLSKFLWSSGVMMTSYRRKASQQELESGIYGNGMTHHLPLWLKTTFLLPWSALCGSFFVYQQFKVHTVPPPVLEYIDAVLI